MFDGLTGLHTWNREQWTSDTCEVLVWDAGTSSWAGGVVVACEVQPFGSSVSSSDEDMASPEETRTIRVYVAVDVGVDVGNRIRWRANEWDVVAVDGERSRGWGVALTCQRPQTGLRAEMITFRRRVNGVWLELGTYPMRFTRTVPVTSTMGTVEQVAAGGAYVAVMLGGEATDVLEVGDWFGRDGVPGRITGKDTDRGDHIEFRYEMEVVVP